ncbi:MAG: molybdopterin-containing oxidoreductase family protein [Lachnospiraceae bacterium]|jgi:anaerobic selenocysteine-containing dehydrogenase
MNNSERLRKAKIPCEETGITIKHTLCDICSPGIHCGVDAYVKDDEILKIEGTDPFPANNGALCTKGAVGRQYAYREDRIKTPMRRIGPRGSDEFEPVSWEDAFSLAAEGLNTSKARYGAEATFFLAGYSKWFRTFLHRLAYSFGSPNYLSESSVCWWSNVMASRCVFGHSTLADIPNARLVVIWGTDPFTKNIHQSKQLFALKERGGKIIVIDPRRNAAAELLSDLYLRPRFGTDGYLAHAMANYIIENNLYDAKFVELYVDGFEEYRAYVANFTLAEAESITGMSAADIIKAAEMLATIKPAALSTGTGTTHHLNGFNNNRSMYCLAAICGQFDKPGTLKPGTGPATYCYSPGGFVSKEQQFINSVKPKNAPPTVGLTKFPLFAEMMNEGQGMDLANQILSAKPYPLKSAFLAGVNHMMYPESTHFLNALKSLNFIVASDIFWTRCCRIADIVFPACTSYERSEIKCYQNKFMFYTRPAIPPRFESRPDTDIFFGLARALGLDDELLCSDYDTCARWILEESSGIKNWESFKASTSPIVAPSATTYNWGDCLKQGVKTPSGRIELVSRIIAKYTDCGLDALPTYNDSCGNADSTEYPFILATGCRNHNTIHSRLHACRWARSLRPAAEVDINPVDAKTLDIKQGDFVELSTVAGAVSAKANITLSANTGELLMGHGYAEANVNELIPSDHLDPYTGFPGYKQIRCKLLKKIQTD